jgi:hypothetical protein
MVIFTIKITDVRGNKKTLEIRKVSKNLETSLKFLEKELKTYKKSLSFSDVSNYGYLYNYKRQDIIGDHNRKITYITFSAFDDISRNDRDVRSMLELLYDSNVKYKGVHVVEKDERGQLKISNLILQLI